MDLILIVGALSVTLLAVGVTAIRYGLVEIKKAREAKQLNSRMNRVSDASPKIADMPNSSKAMLFVLTAWFVIALLVGLSGVFRNANAFAVAITVWTLTVAALLACLFAPAVREWVATVDIRWLIAPHLVRFVGLYFLFLGQRGDLAAGFARPAGIGDVIAATLAVIILAIPALRQRRKILLAWNTFGLIDIVFVVFSAFYHGLVAWPEMRPLRDLPLSLLPMFVVPIVIASHILIFVRLRDKR